MIDLSKLKERLDKEVRATKHETHALVYALSDMAELVRCDCGDPIAIHYVHCALRKRNTILSSLIEQLR